MRRHTAAKRERALALLADGNSIAEIARRTHVPRTTVWEWCNANRPRVAAGPAEPASPSWVALLGLQGQLVERVVALGPEAALTDPVCVRLRVRLDDLSRRMWAGARAFADACDRERHALIVAETYGVEVAA